MDRRPAAAQRPGEQLAGAAGCLAQARTSGATAVTRRLLEYWTAPDRDRPLFFCQVEALETVIYLTECAAKQGDGWTTDRVRQANADANPELLRTAMKMATGTARPW
ncbi:type III restriction enzyme [Modestobacter sp. DSM 44400]|uniref:hypothetical protein n=1 Tax=Modestobacter sp. DSM 44400 TaxID=1550230 RepID=UPI0008952133|nr:hypothetical protein [Modestobacter sp. DSM 44400]SDY44390.1 type III restriction enzyme [Modestobacter sp. DSM 44400]